MTFPAWIDRIEDFRVEKREGRRPGGQAYLRLVNSTRQVIWHTTEGSSVDAAVETLRRNFSCPHFVIGPNRIVQMRPLWAQAATVRGDNSRSWQVEVVGFSKQGLWTPDEPTARAFAALLRFFRGRLDVPFRRPDGWRDDCRDIDGIWATTSNSRRRSRRAPGFAGHVMHLEWPENTHWDQGAIAWSRMFELAKGDEDMAVLTTEEQKQLRNFLNELADQLGAPSARAAARRVAGAVVFTERDTPEPEDGISFSQADERYAVKDHPHTAETTVETTID